MFLSEEIQYYLFENAFNSFVFTWLVLYVLYYNLKVKHVPTLICKPGKFKSFLYKNCPILSEVYYPTIWCFEARLQTIIQTFVRPIQCMKYRREHLQTWDGGEVCLDWIDNDNDTKFTSKNRPTVMLLPGLVGSTDARYIQYMIRQLQPMGYRCVVLNYRGVCGGKLKTPRTYCAACTRDLASAVEHVTARLPHAPLMAAGFSLGGIILFNYAARMGEDCPLAAIMTISSPWDPLRTSDNLEKPLNCFLFNRTLLNYLLECISLHRDVLAPRINMDNVFKSRTIREFDESFTAQMFDYPDAEAYYRDSKLTADKVKRVAVPALCMAATDDPFIPDGSFPIEAVSDSDNVALFLTAYGGHGGFLEGLNPWKKPNYMDRVFGQFVSAVMDRVTAADLPSDEMVFRSPLPMPTEAD